MASFPKLRQAMKDLGLEVDPDFLKALTKNPDAVTERDIVKVLREAGLARTAADVANLYAILTLANGGDVEIELEADAATSIVETEDAKQPSPQAQVVTEPIVEQSKSIEPESVTFFDLSQYSEVDIKPSQDQRIQSLEILPGNPGQKVISWKSPRGSSQVFVLAAGSSSFPRTVKNSESTWITDNNSITIQADYRFFSLFVFKKAGERGALLAQGRVLGEITDLEFEPYEDQVRLRWSASDSLARVCMYRSKPDSTLPENPAAALRIQLADDATTYIDTDVKPGQQFEYKVYLEWEGPDGRVIPTPGKQVVVSVPGRISEVSGFKVTRLNPTSPYVDIEYDEPDTGSVKVFQVKGLPNPELLRAKAGETEIDVDTLTNDYVKNWLGTEVIDLANSEDGKVKIGKVPMLTGDRSSRTYTAVGILGRKARISNFKVIQQVGDISKAVLIDRYDYQILRVEIPDGAQSLKIWLKSKMENPILDASALGNADRTVQIDEEYRRFGGVLFARNVPGFPGLTELEPEPLSIFVQGISTFDGETHESPVFHVEYPGRITLKYRRGSGAISTPEPKPKGIAGLFKSDKSSVAHVGSQPLQIQSSAPANQASFKLNLRYFTASTFPLDEKTPSSDKNPFLEIVPEQFSKWSNYPPKNDNQPNQQPLLIPDGKKFRLASTAPSSNNVPIFTVDERVDAAIYEPISRSANNKELSVVLVGAKQSGKTTFVQAILNYFDQQLSQSFAAKLMPLDDNDPIAKSRLEDMTTFIKSGILPKATRSAKEFLSADPDAQKDPADPTKSLNFRFYNGGDVPLSAIRMIDVAGEDMDSLESMKYYEAALLKADLIIFLMDPLQLESVRVSLAGTPLPPKGTDPFFVLENLTQILTGAKDQRNPNQKIAVTMSKFDSFQQVSELKTSALAGVIQNGMQITRDPNSNASYLYNEMDGRLVEEELLAILERLNTAPFTSLVKNTFSQGQYRYFALSSLGHATHAEKMDDAGITSFRVSDAVRWALT